MCVCLSVCQVHRGKTADQMDAVWDGRSDGSRDEAGSWVWISSWNGVNLGANVGHPIATFGEFAASWPIPKSLWDFLL